MDDAKVKVAEIGKSTIGAGRLCSVAGLSYRQLNEWEKRKMLPSQREGVEGWRRANGWQAMSLRIIADLRSEFSVPLTRLRGLLLWMLGEVATPSQHRRLQDAEELLFCAATSEVPITGSKGSLKEATKNVTMTEQRGPKLQSAVSSVQAGLVARGWDPDSAKSFAARFLTLSMGRKFGVQSTSEICGLLDEAIRFGDRQAANAVQGLGTSLLPLMEALSIMTIGFPLFLVTDLETSYFLNEPTYLEWRRLGALPQKSMVVTVNDALNAVLIEMGQKEIPIPLRASSISRNEEEAVVLDMLRARDFDQLVVEPKSGGFHIVIHRRCPVEDIEAVAKILKEHEYQSVTVKQFGGKIVHTTQAVSVLTGNGKKARPGEHKDKQVIRRKQ